MIDIVKFIPSDRAPQLFALALPKKTKKNVKSSQVHVNTQPK